MAPPEGQFSDPVDVVLTAPAAVSIKDAGAGTTQLSVKPDGTAIPALQGGALVAGRDPGGLQKDLRVDVAGNLLVASTTAIGTDIQTSGDTVVSLPIGTVATLPAVPANALRVRVQNTVQDTLIRVREASGVGGSGVILSYLGVAEYGGVGGAIERLEAQLISGIVNGAAAVQYEVQ